MRPRRNRQRPAVHRRNELRQKFRVFDKLTGKLLWETVLPAAGNATPSIYEIRAANMSSSFAEAEKTARPPQQHRGVRASLTTLTG